MHGCKKFLKSIYFKLIPKRTLNHSKVKNQRLEECVRQEIVCKRELRELIGIYVAMLRSVYRTKLKHRIVGCGKISIRLGIAQPRSQGFSLEGKSPGNEVGDCRKSNTLSSLFGPCITHKCNKNHKCNKLNNHKCNINWLNHKCDKLAMTSKSRGYKLAILILHEIDLKFSIRPLKA